MVKSPYGEGGASDKIVKILEKVQINNILKSNSTILKIYENSFHWIGKIF